MTSPYFNNYTTAVEIDLYADLYNELIYLNGFVAYYIPNTNEAQRDLLFGDDPLKKFTVTYKLDAYLVDGSDYSDQSDFFSKFGLEVRNNIKLQFTTREFVKKVKVYDRPREGDLIYIPFLKNKGELFEIQFVNTSKDLNMLARATPYYYELSLEPFKYNDEVIDTGIASIDLIEDLYSFRNTLTLASGTGNYIPGEFVYQGANSNSYIAMANVSEWDATNLTLVVINTKGDFTSIDAHNIIGSSSGASYTLTTDVDTIQTTEYDNFVIHDSAIGGIIDNSEVNPFGSLSRY